MASNFSFRSAAIDEQMGAIMQQRRSENLDGFTLIASENHPHPDDEAAYRDAADASFSGGYFEGYPPQPGDALGSGRYYQGVKNADLLEDLARERIKATLAPGMQEKAAVNVQAPSGAIANMASYAGVLRMGDKVVSPSLSNGYGHLSHGADSPNVVKDWFKVAGYGIDPSTGLIDYDAMERVVLEHQPRLLIAGFSSYPREVDWKRIAQIAERVGAVTLADISHPGGLIGAALMRNPFLEGIDIVTSTTHKTWGGLKGAIIIYNKESLARKAPERTIQKGKRKGEFNGIDFSVFPGMLGGPNMCTIASYASTFRRAQTTEFREVQQRTMTNAAALADELIKRGWPIMTGGTDNHIVLVRDVTAIAGIDKQAITDGWEAALLLEQGVGLVTNKNAIPGVPGNPIRPLGLRLGTPALSTRGMGPAESREIASIIDETLRSAKDLTKLGKLRERVRELAHQFPVPAYR